MAAFSNLWNKQAVKISPAAGSFRPQGTEKGSLYSRLSATAPLAPLQRGGQDGRWPESQQEHLSGAMGLLPFHPTQRVGFNHPPIPNRKEETGASAVVY